MKVAIYALTEGGRIRYIGKAFDPRHRFRQHLSERGTSPKCQWLEQLRQVGQRPELRVLEEVPAQDAGRAELRWIRRLHARGGLELVNVQGTGRPRRRSVTSVRFQRSPEELHALVRAHLLAGANDVR